nr:MAG TPA: hypothetical protein [Caudoviricetes sp.]
MASLYSTQEYVTQRVSGSFSFPAVKRFLMAQQQYTLFKKFIGYGHYKLIIADKEGTRMEAVTGDMDLISRLSSELEEEREKATEEAINYVLQES